MTKKINITKEDKAYIEFIESIGMFIPFNDCSEYREQEDYKAVVYFSNKLETALQLLRELDVDLEFTAREVPVRIYKDSETHLQIKEIIKEGGE